MNNPIFAFQARRRMRSLQVPIILTLYTSALTAVAALTSYARFLGPTFLIGDMSAQLAGYLLVLLLQFALLLLVAPAVTASAISGERERQTLDLLLVTGTSSLKLMLGKLLESFCFLALMVVCSMPVLSLIILTGSATVTQVLQSVAFLILFVLYALSIGLMCSTLFRRAATSTIASYLAVFLIGILTLLPLWYDVKRIGDLYDALTESGIQVQALDYTPISFIINPGLGLFALLESQTAVFYNSLWSVSYTLSVTLDFLPLQKCVYGNMIFMAVASAALILLGALRLRPGRERIRRR